MTRSRRVILAALCVEAVAAVSVVVYGHLALVAVAVLYWIDLLFVMGRVGVQRLLARPTRGVEIARLLPPFRLLKHKRGTVTLTDRLPPVYPKNAPIAMTTLLWGGLISVPTVLIAALSVPGEFWSNPATPLLFTGGALAAATKSWLLLGEHVATGAHEREPPTALNPWKRQALFVFYAVILYLASDFTLSLVAENGVADARRNAMVLALIVVLLRLAYSVRVSHTRFGSDPGTEGQDSEDSEDGAGADRVISWLRSKATEQETAVLTPPSTPDRRPFQTVEPESRSVLAAGVLNALAAGHVVDGQFSDAGLNLRVLLIFEFLFSLLFLLDGGVIPFLFLNGLVFGLLAVLSALSIVHLRLALGEVEYRFYDAELVAYDRRLGEPQWAVPYDRIEDISVETGVFGRPLWLDAGTVSFERTDSPPEEALATREPRSSIAFVSEPERVAEMLRSRGGR
jgi:hypothetical protein